jgi:hypothetical protein
MTLFVLTACKSDQEKVLEEKRKIINLPYIDTKISTELAAEYAMDFADEQKPSDLSKMEKERERANYFILSASSEILEVTSKVGISIEELK